jgi:glycosyltransferase involved in cell wall biosynthesis
MGSLPVAPETSPPGAGQVGIEVSVVMPCLNEAETLATCIRKAKAALERDGIAGEIIVADNGSKDQSREIAAAEGARLIEVEERGYGSALIGGIAAAQGRYVIMADADDSYDFGEIGRFVEKLREGNDLVQGCRLPTGGGTVMPGAMPFLHRRLGNPGLTMLVRSWFHAPVNDVYCGMRGFTKALYERLDQRCTGMEFATEMIIKSSLRHERIAEVPITLHPDGRTSHPPHLKTFRDGWRTLRFFLMYSPRWLFLFPGALLFLAGLVGYALAMPGVSIGRVTFDAHTLLFATLAIIAGYQSILFAVFTKTFAMAERLMPEDPRMMRFFRIVNLERGIVISVVSILAGIVLLLAAVNRWRLTGFGHLDYAQTMRLVIPGAALVALGFQTLLSSFFVSILGMARR